MRAHPDPVAYLGSDRAGTEFWLSGPHVFSSADGARTRYVCALARFNRRSRTRRNDRRRRGSPVCPARS